MADDKSYHVNHFCCIDCDLELAGHSYIVVDQNPVCLGCYEKNHGKTMTEKDQRAAEKRKATFHLNELEERKKRAIQKLKEELKNIDEEIEKIKS